MAGDLKNIKKGAAAFAAFLALLYISLAAAEAAEGYSLEAAVQTGLKNNPEYSSATNTRLAVEDQLREAKALYLPTLSLSAESGYEATRTPIIRDEEMYRRRASLTLSQLLFDGFRTSGEITRQKARLRSAEYRNYKTSELVALNIVNAYIDVLRRRELADAAEGNIKDHQAIFERIKDGADNGKFNQGDLEQIRSRLARARANLDSVRQSLEDADAAYRHAAGAPPPRDLLIPVFSPAWLPAGVDDFLAQARRTSPALAGFQADLDAATAEAEQRKSAFYPEVSLQMSGARGKDVDGISGHEANDAALVVLKWDLFNGGADLARRREALHREAAARDDRRNAERVLENDVRNAWSARVSATGQLAEYKQQVKANEKVFNVYQEQFQLGRRTLIDVLNAQNELFNAKSNQINLFYSQLFSGYQMLALRGDLVRTLEGKSPDAPEKPLVVREKTPVKKAAAESLKAAAAEPAAGGLKAAEKTAAAPARKTAAAPAKKTAKKQAAQHAKKTAPALYLHLGAYHTQAEAEARWQELSQGNDDLLSGLGSDIRRTDLGKYGVYYRVQAGPVTQKNGKALCRELDARKTGGCFVGKG